MRSPADAALEHRQRLVGLLHAAEEVGARHDDRGMAGENGLGAVEQSGAGIEGAGGFLQLRPRHQQWGVARGSPR